MNTKWQCFDFGSNVTIRKKPEKRPTKEKNTNISTDTKSNPSVPISKKIAFDFFSKITPKTVEELAVHPKKIKEVENWIDHQISLDLQKTPFLLISGPTGCGKTITVNVLCKTKNISLSEWINPIDRDFDLNYHGNSQRARFLEFLLESKWNSLFENSDMKKVVLVKDFPNFVLTNPEEFVNILEEVQYHTKRPIIFICSEVSLNGINIIHTLFPPEVLSKFNISHISFNACASTIMKQAIKRAQNIINAHPDLFKTPSDDTIDAILQSSMGDIRSAMNQLNIACLIGTNELPTEITLSKPGNKRKRSKNINSLKSMEKDEALDLFHALGRVLNAKRNENGQLTCNLEKLVEELSSQPSRCCSFLFENYLKYFGDFDEVVRASDYFSLADLLLISHGEYNATSIYSVWLVVLGIMVNNVHKVSKWTPITGPKKIDKKPIDCLENEHLHPVDYFYINLINKNDNYHKFDML